MNCAHVRWCTPIKTGKLQAVCGNRNSGSFQDWMDPNDSCMQWKEEEDEPDQPAGCD